MGLVQIVDNFLGFGDYSTRLHNTNPQYTVRRVGVTIDNRVHKKDGNVMTLNTFLLEFYVLHDKHPCYACRACIKEKQILLL